MRQFLFQDSPTSIRTVENYQRDIKTGVDAQIVATNTSTPLLNGSNNSLSSNPAIGTTFNDRHALLQRLIARKAQREAERVQQKLDEKPAYLDDERYAVYKNRKRQDNGKDGKPVWPAHLEQSFQRALVAIPPMGRKKRSQNGKPHGRNELISLWILQETGEWRDRKQISSHIQVIKGFLKGSPEWDAVTIPQESSDHAQGGVDYYADSIEDMVRSLRQRAMQPGTAFYLGEPLTLLPSNVHMGLASFYFDMWACQPYDVQECFHNYTRVRSVHAPAIASTSLDNLEHWRKHFPDLEPVLHNWPNEQSCDIILLRASLKVMSDHPPAGSKLGMAYELDFRTPAGENFSFLEQVRSWSSKTYIYRHGDLIQKSTSEHLLSHKLGTVRPLLECAWWAKQLGELTDKRRQAEDRQDDAAIVAAEQESRNFFKSVTILQEIYASTNAGTDPVHIETNSKKRMAILLWTFAQTCSGRTGTTSWQRLLPPTKGSPTGSPSPSTLGSASSELLPRTTFEPHEQPELSHCQRDFSHDNLRADVGAVYDQHHHEAGNFIDQPMLDDDCLGFPNLSEPFNCLPQEQFGAADFGSYECFEYHPQSHLYHHLPDTNHAISSQAMLPFNHENLHYQTHELDIEMEDGYEQYPIPTCSQVIVDDHESASERLPLSNFDGRTHTALQAQLGNAYGVETTITSHVDIGPDCQRSTVEDVQQPGLDVEMMRVELTDELGRTEVVKEHSASASASSLSQIPNIEFVSARPFSTPKADRPTLFSHHSFSGVVHTDNESLLDTPVRQDYAWLMAQLNRHDNDEISHSSIASGDYLDLPADLRRPQSQPILTGLGQQDIDAFGSLEAEYNFGNNIAAIKFEDLERGIAFT